MTTIPPIKSQGIKTKLVDWIAESARHVRYDRWVEPFAGTGVVAYNVQPNVALLCDSNPHIIAFYQSIQAKEITSNRARKYLVAEGQKLLESEGEHYYVVRERFNKEASPLDFLFLSRACFNGMMRFNKSGGFNVPFCKKPNRFSKSLVTKICNQIDAVSSLIEIGEYTFKCQAFPDTLRSVGATDLVYCDPPYIGRHVDYFDSWSAADEETLNQLLSESTSRFIMSTWLKNKYRTNEYVYTTWRDCFIVTKNHYYHVGATERNRAAVTEALLTNFATHQSRPIVEFDHVVARDSAVPCL